MAGEPIITVTGNLGSNAEFKKLQSGTPVTSFSLANTPRKQKMGVWSDGETTWFRVFVWGLDAVGAASTLRKGDKVIVTGNLKLSKFVGRDGLEKQTLEINAESVGVVPRKTPEPSSLAETRFGEEQINPDDVPW